MAERHITDESDMVALGAELADVIQPPAVLRLDGNLGAGKTTLARGFLWALGHVGPVRSPTYTLVETYPLASAEVHHLDLYRVADPEELEFLGVRDLVSERAIWLIEWADRGGDEVPPADYTIRIDFEAGGRRVSGLPASLAAPSDLSAS